MKTLFYTLGSICLLYMMLRELLANVISGIKWYQGRQMYPNLPKPMPIPEVPIRPVKHSER